MTDDSQTPPDPDAPRRPGQPGSDRGPAPSSIPKVAAGQRGLRSIPGGAGDRADADRGPVLGATGFGGGDRASPADRRPDRDAGPQEPIRLRRRPPPPGAEKPTLAGAPLTVALLIAMVGIELFLNLADNIPAQAPGQAGEAVRRLVYDWFALRPIEPIALWFGEAGPSALIGLVTHMLLHGGLFHILFNGAATLVLAPPLERRLGTPRFAILFLISGIAGGLAHTGWEWMGYLADPDTGRIGLAIPLVGASGAISGLLAAQIVDQARITRAYAVDAAERRRAVGLAARIAIAFLAVNAAIMWLDSFVSGASHMGGFVGGLILALLLRPRRA